MKTKTQEKFIMHRFVWTKNCSRKKSSLVMDRFSLYTGSVSYKTNEKLSVPLSMFGVHRFPLCTESVVDRFYCSLNTRDPK
jgi:hypothetical protein